MPNVGFYYKCNNCGLRMESMSIRFKPTPPGHTDIDEVTRLVNEDAKKCPECKTKSGWTFYRKARL